MIRLRRVVLLAILLCMVVSCPSMAEVLLAPADQLFSAKFANQPDEKSVEKGGLVQHMYSSPESAKLFMVSHTLWPIEPDPIVAMQSILDGFMERIAAELLSIEKKNFLSATGKKLPAKRFTFGNAKVWGEGVVVTAGRRSYVVLVATRKPAEGLDATGKKFIASFKILN